MYPALWETGKFCHNAAKLCSCPQKKPHEIVRTASYLRSLIVLMVGDIGLEPMTPCL